MDKFNLILLKYDTLISNVITKVCPDEVEIYEEHKDIIIESSKNMINGGKYGFKAEPGFGVEFDLTSVVIIAILYEIIKEVTKEVLKSGISLSKDIILDNIKRKKDELIIIEKKYSSKKTNGLILDNIEAELRKIKNESKKI